MRTESIVAAAIVGLTWCCGALPASGQFQAPPNSLEYEDTATVEAVQEHLLKVRDSKNDEWILETGDQTRVTVNGEAERECLRSGMFVQFKGELNKKGALQNDVEEVSIVTAEDKSSLGFFAVEDEDRPGKPVRNPTGGEYIVRGKLLTYRDGQFMVLAGSRKLSGKMAGDLKVKLDVDDLSLAQTGDSVKVKAWYYEKTRPVAAFNQAGRAVAEEITITLSKPLAYTGKKPRSSEKASKSTAKSIRVSK
jgi:hypothetical protein